jgi:hypothetical protein
MSITRHEICLTGQAQVVKGRALWSPEPDGSLGKYVESYTPKLPNLMGKLHTLRCELLTTEPLNVVAPNMLPTAAQHSQAFRTGISEVDIWLTASRKTGASFVLR